MSELTDGPIQHCNGDIGLGLAGALALQEPAPDFLARPVPSAVRALTWNVYRNSVFPPPGGPVDVASATRPAQFGRVLRALQPDVVCLQEVTVAAQQSAALLDQILPQRNGHAWQAHAELDTVILTRFTLGARGGGGVDDGQQRRGHAIAIIPTPAFDLYMICAHFQSSDRPRDHAMRRQQAEQIASTIREAQAGGGGVPLPFRTPFVILGDFNAIPNATAFVDIILSGNQALTAAGGATVGLDWDGSTLTDARPRHNVSRADVYTWRNDLEQFPPGILDRILYSDSTIVSANQFVLDTTAMSYEELVRSGMRSIDVMLDPQAGIHDHFPLVIDLVVR